MMEQSLDAQQVQRLALYLATEDEDTVGYP
jgi:hypothetical protein